MCGIVGYIGEKDAFPIIIKGLQRLEYRGYDSAGVALCQNKDELTVFKKKGNTSRFSKVCQGFRSLQLGLPVT